MKIVREKSSGVVLYFFNDGATVEITETSMRGDIVAMDIKADTYELLTGVEPTAYHQLGGALSYIDDVWAIANSDLYAAHVEQLAEQELARIMRMTVTMSQARKALILGGVSITAVNEAIADILDPTERQLAETDWEYSTTVRRDSALVASIAPVLGLTEAEIDELFVLAATL
jgi:response regulator RpfG family c-di-GMP phosphodiesterase